MSANILWHSKKASRIFGQHEKLMRPLCEMPLKQRFDLLPHLKDFVKA